MIVTYSIEKVKNKNNFNRIVNEIKKLQNIESVHINKQSSTLYVDIINSTKEQEEEKIKNAIKRFEKNAIIKELVNEVVHRKVLYLKGLDCGNCALKIENIAKRTFNYEQILVDFATTRFIIETKDQNLINDIKKEVEKVAHIVDPNIIVMDQKASKKERVEEVYKINKKYLSLMIIGMIIFIIGGIIHHFFNNTFTLKTIAQVMFLISYLLVGHPIIIMFFKNIIRGRFFDENFLMTIASIGAFATGHYVEAVMVVFLYQLGERLQDYAVNKSRRSISELLTLDAETTKLKIGAEITEVDVETVLPGDIIVVGVGELIPLDGVVSNGKTALDTKSITGEAALLSVKPGDSVISGSINAGSVIEIKVTNAYSESMISKILDLVENASTKKAKAENFITKFARVYTPVVVICALLMAIITPLIINFIGSELSLLELFNKYVYKAMIFLVISCPCAIVISVPLSFFAGIGLSSKRGILIKGSNYLEALSKAKHIVFDKTGTLTKGEFKVLEIIPADETITENDVLKNLAYVEYYSNHPIGVSVLEKYGKDKIFPEIITDYNEISGKGVKACINGTIVYAGNEKLVKDMFENIELLDKHGAVLYVVRDKKYLGAVVIGDIIRDEAPIAIKNLRKNGISSFSMLTGDSKTAGNYFANILQMDNVYSELLPDQKVEIFETIKEKHKDSKIIYVGDGINDAPVIASSDVGIAMGSVGSDATIQIADVVIMSDNLDKINEVLLIAKKTKQKVIQNIVFALLLKLVVLLVSIFGIVPLWLAIFSDVGVSLLAIINSMTITTLFNKKDKNNEN